jgi:hypothetical protein
MKVYSLNPLPNMFIWYEYQFQASIINRQTSLHDQHRFYLAAPAFDPGQRAREQGAYESFVDDGGSYAG